MTGDFLVRQLRSIRPDLPIIMCSGYSEELFGEGSDLTSVTELLLKPISKNQYIDAIEKIMKNRNRSKTTNN
jgi:YesN/AraC family two-component response regulator